MSPTVKIIHRASDSLSLKEGDIFQVFGRKATWSQHCVSREAALRQVDSGMHAAVIFLSSLNFILLLDGEMKATRFVTKLLRNFFLTVLSQA